MRPTRCCIAHTCPLQCVLSMSHARAWVGYETWGRNILASHLSFVDRELSCEELGVDVLLSMFCCRCSVVDVLLKKSGEWRMPCNLSLGLNRLFFAISPSLQTTSGFTKQQKTLLPSLAERSSSLSAATASQPRMWPRERTTLLTPLNFTRWGKRSLRAMPSTKSRFDSANRLPTIRRPSPIVTQAQAIPRLPGWRLAATPLEREPACGIKRERKNVVSCKSLLLDRW